MPPTPKGLLQAGPFGWVGCCKAGDLEIFYYVYAKCAVPAAKIPTPTLQRLQVQLAHATSAQACQQRRSAAINRTETRLSAARNCRYNGLPPCAYFPLRHQCRSTPQLEQRLSNCTTSCQMVQRKLEEERASCTVIGWDMSGRRERCGRIDLPKARLQELRERDCGEVGEVGVGELERRLRTEEDRVRQELGVAESPYETLVLEPVGAVPDAAVVVLHGLGQSIEDMRPLVEGLRESGEVPRVRFVLAQAPVQRNDFLGRRAPSWFNILNDEIGGEMAVDDIIAAAANVDALMEIQRRVYGIRADRIVVYGFSQGAALALTVNLRHVTGGAFSFSGFLPIADTYPEALNPAAVDAPASMVHGVDDDTVPILAARLSRDVLIELGRDLVYREFEGEGHDLAGVLPEVQAAALTLINKALG